MLWARRAVAPPRRSEARFRRPQVCTQAPVSSARPAAIPNETYVLFDERLAFHDREGVCEMGDEDARVEVGGCERLRQLAEGGPDTAILVQARQLGRDD